MAPLSEEYAFKIMGEAAKDKPSGTYVTATVGKKMRAGRKLYFIWNTVKAAFLSW